MKSLGLLLLCAGAIGLLLAFGADTSVDAGFGQRVNNLGLMADRQNTILLSAVVAIVGAIMLAAPGGEPTEVSMTAPPAGLKVCPWCAEQVQAAAVICRYCQRALAVADRDAQGVLATESPVLTQEQRDQVSMDKHGIRFDGKQYIYLEYRYDRLKDAVAYAELLASQA